MVSQLLADIPQIAELDINPLLVDAQGGGAGRAHPRQHGRAGRCAELRDPALPGRNSCRRWTGTAHDDPAADPPRGRGAAPRLPEHLDPEDIRLRVFYSRRSIERSELARLTQIDYAREMAFVATAPGMRWCRAHAGVVRAVADPDNVEAEFGIIVRSEMKGEGLGELLMKQIIDYLRRHGTQRPWPRC